MLHKIGYVVVFVRQWEEAMRFYADTLGIEVARRRDSDGFAELRFSAGGPPLLLEDVAKADVGSRGVVGKFVGLSVAVADIQRTYEELSAAGVPFDKPPQRQSWGGMLTHFFDPDGNMWSMVEED